jgi:site-specific DNA recombinase
MVSTKSKTSSITIALLYTRVSTDEQARDGVSLGAQLADCRAYAARPGWVLGPEFQDVLSGTRDDRPQYQALLAEAKRLRAAGQAVAVVVWRLDRLGRRVLERVRCREELKALGVATHSIREGGEVSDLVANILASVAEEEVRQLSERVSGALQHIRANGWHPTGRVPWGYLTRPATAAERQLGACPFVLDLDAIMAPFAREAFQRIADGASIRQVAAWAASLPESARGRRRFSVTSMCRSLTSPSVLGRVILAGPPAHWPALIDQAMWDAVQARLWRHRVVPHQASGKALLTGFVRCEQCGSRMYSWSYNDPRPPRSGPRRLRAYACEGRGKVGGCRRCVQPADAIDALVRAEMVALLDRLAETDGRTKAALGRAWAALQAPCEDKQVDAQRRQLERTAEQARQRLLKAAEMYVDGKLDRDAYEGVCDKARADLDAASAALQRTEPATAPPTLPPLAHVLRLAGGWSAALAAADVPMQRDILAELITQVAPVRLRRGHYRADIKWTPLGDALDEIARAEKSVA